MILAPIGTTIWVMENNAAGAGMGTSGLVGQIMTFQTMGFSSGVLIRMKDLQRSDPMRIYAG